MGIFTNLNFTSLWRSRSSPPALVTASPVEVYRKGGAELYRRAQSLREPEIRSTKSPKQICAEAILAVVNTSNNLAVHQLAARHARSVPATAVDKPPPAASATGSRLIFPDAANLRIAQQWQGQQQTLALLRQAGYLQQDDADTDFSIRMVVAAVDFLARDATHDDGPQQAALAESLLQDQRPANDGTQPPLTHAQRRDMIRAWIETSLFGTRIDELLVAHLSTLAPATIFRTSDLHSWLHNKCHQQLDKGITPQDGLSNEVHVSRWIWDHVVTPALPLLVYARQEPVMSLPLSDFEWGQRHAGLLLASLTGLDVSTVAAEQGLALGKMLLAELDTNAELKDWKALFLLPARCYQALRPTSKSAASRQATLDNYLADHEQALRQRCPITHFKNLMDAFRTRPQIAQEIIQRRCPDLVLERLLENGAGVCGNSFHSSYGDPTALFRQEVATLSQAFGKLDKLMLAGAWFGLDANEISFINRASIRLANSEIMLQQLLLSLSDTLRWIDPVLALTLHLLSPWDIDALKAQWRDRLSRMEIIMARSGQEIRTYEMDRSGSQYTVKRRSTHQIDDSNNEDNSIVNAIKTLWIDALLINNGEGTMLNAMLDALVEQHRASFYQQMETFGYHKTTLENIEEFVLSLIPFYTCITEASQGNTARAVFACTIDVLMLIPVFGEITALTARVGEAYVQGARAAIAAASEMAARNTMKEMLQASAAEFIVHGLRPAAEVIGKEEIASLGLAVLRAADPGIELSVALSQAGLRRIVDLGKYLTRYTPELEKILSRLAQQLDQLPEHIRMGEAMAAPATPEQLALLRELEEQGRTALIDAGSLGLLAQKLGVELSWLDEHLHLTGELTDRAKRLLEQADADQVVVSEPLTSLQLSFGEAREHDNLVGHPPADPEPDARASTSNIADQEKIIADVLALTRDGTSATQALQILQQRNPAMPGLTRYFSRNQITGAGQRLVDSLDASSAQMQALHNQDASIRGATILKWREFLVKTDRLHRHSMEEFCKNNRLDMTEFASYVTADGAITHRGLQLLADESPRTIKKFPPEALIIEWNASLVRNEFQATALAEKYEVEAYDFIFHLPVIQRLSEHGAELHSGSGARPLSLAKVVIDRDGTFQDIPLTMGGLRSKALGKKKKISPWTAYFPGKKSPDLHLSTFYSIRDPSGTGLQSANNCQEHLLVWANLNQNQRDRWTLLSFGEYFHLGDLVWRESAKENGHLTAYWSGFGKGWLDGTAATFTSASLTALQLDFLRWPGAPEKVPDFARQQGLTPEFVYRTLNPDGSLTLFGKRMKVVFKFAVDDARLAKIEQFRSAANIAEKKVLSTSQLPPHRLQHELVWHHIGDHLRQQWTRRGFATHFEIAYRKWLANVSESGQFTRRKSTYHDKWERDTLPPINVERLLALQSMVRNAAALQTLDMTHFAQNNQVSPKLLAFFLYSDGSLTENGDEFVRIFKEAIAGPSWEIRTLNGEDISDPEWPELQQRAVASASHDIAPGNNRPSIIETVVTDHPASPLQQSAIAQLPIQVQAENAAHSSGSEQALAEPQAKQIKLEPEALPERAHHQTNNAWPILQDPDDRMISLAHEQGLINALGVTQWYEMTDVFKDLPRNEVVKTQRQITREVRDWLTLGDHYGEKMDALLSVYEDLSTRISAGQTVAAKVDLKQFQVLGPYAGALHKPNSASLRTATRQRGAGRVLAYLWNTPAGGAIDGYQRGNTLSLVNTNMLQTADGQSVIAGKNNVAAIGVDENYIFYIAKESIKAGTELLVNYGSHYDPHQLVKDEEVPSD